MPKSYKVTLAGSKSERTEYELQTGQRWMITLSDYRKITKITPKKSRKDLTISYVEKQEGAEEVAGKQPLEEFVMWLLEKGAERLVVSYDETGDVHTT